MRPHRNPHVGRHPDLFEPHGTPIFKPLSELSEDEIIELPRRAFSFDEWQELSSAQRVAVADNGTMSLKQLMDEDLWDSLNAKGQLAVLGKIPRDEIIGTPEWEALDDSDKEWFIENDGESEDLIDAVVKPFKDAYEWATEPGDQYLIDNVDTNYFESWLQEHADHLVDLARGHDFGDSIDEIVAEHTANGYSEEQVLQVIDEAMREVGNYDKEVGASGFFTENVNSGGMYLDAPWEAAKKLAPEEMKIAIERINSVTDGVLRSRWNTVTAEKLVDQHQTFEAEIEGDYVSFNPDWTAISTAVETALEDIEPEDAEPEEGAEPKPKKLEKPLEERIVHRFKDGSFVVELLPRELTEEGAPYACDTHGHFYPAGELFAGGPSAECPKCAAASPRSDESLHMCIGAPSQRYLKSVRKGVGKAWSLRTASGKKKIAIFADLKPDGSIRRIDQAKGKHNRLPGFEASKHGGSGRDGKFKPTEVVQVAEFIASLGIDPYTVNDVAPGMKAAVGKMDDNPEVEKSVLTLKNISPSYAEDVPRLYEAWRSLPTREDVAGLPRENPARLCHRCGGARGGFCS